MSEAPSLQPRLCGGRHGLHRRHGCLTEQHGICPPPGGWVARGRCIRHSDKYLLVAGSAAAYGTPVANVLTYVANFTGVGTYAVFDSSLNVIFGVYLSGGRFTALCGGSSTPLGSLPVAWTSLALDLHDYQYHGPDPDMALSKFRNREEAAEYTRRLAAEVARRVEALRGRVKWTDELEKALGEVREALAR
jgi:hypothetical protein